MRPEHNVGFAGTEEAQQTKYAETGSLAQYEREKDQAKKAGEP